MTRPDRPPHLPSSADGDGLHPGRPSAAGAPAGSRSLSEEADDRPGEFVAGLLAGYAADRPTVSPGVRALMDRMKAPPAAGPESPSAPRPIARTFGDYDLIGYLGEGGMGQVYRAVNRPLGREEAVKRLHAGQEADPIRLQRFRREMRAAGRLDHPALVRVYAAGEADGVPYLAMELIDGRSLSQVVREAAAAGSAIPVADACRWIADAGEGIQHAHERGVLHRDLKPANLMLDAAGRVRVLDLGLAKVLRPDPADEPRQRRTEPRPGGAASDTTAGRRETTELTAPRQYLGTPDFMAPEQCGGAAAVTAATDVYGLAATLHSLLTGGRLHDAVPPSPAARAGAALFRPAPDVRERRPDAPPALAALLARALSKNPADRPPTAAAFVQALRPFAQVERPSSRMPHRPADRVPRSALSSPPWPWWPPAVLIVATAAVAAWVTWPVLTADVVGNGETVPVAPPSTPPPQPAAESGAVSTELNVWVHDAGAAPSSGRRVGGLSDAPLAAGRKITVSVESEEPLHHYLVMLSSNAPPTMVHPWYPRSTAAGQPPQLWPSAADRAGWDDRPRRAFDVRLGSVDVGRTTETCLLLSRRTPLPADADLEALLRSFPIPAVPSDTRSIVYDAAPPPTPGDDTTEAARSFLATRLKPLFPFARGVSFVTGAPPAD